MNPNKPGTFEKKGQQMGQSIDQGINKTKQVVDKTKKAVSHGYDVTKQHLNTMKDKTVKKIDEGINATKRAYTDVSNSVKQTIDNAREATKQTVNMLHDSINTTVLRLEQYKNQLVNDMKAGLIKAIKFSKDTGTMIVDYGNKTINLLVSNSKIAYQNTTNLIKKGAIASAQIVNDGIQFVDKAGKVVVKYTAAIAVASGLIIYHQGKLAINSTIEATISLANSAYKLNQALNQAIKSQVLQGLQLAKDGRDVLITIGKKTIKVGMDLAIQTGLVITKGTSKVLNTMHTAVQHVNNQLEQVQQAGTEGAKLGVQFANTYSPQSVSKKK